MDIPIIGQREGYVAITCPKCSSSVQVPLPKFEVINAGTVSMVVWVKPTVVCVLCKQEFTGAIIGVHPQGIQTAMMPVEEPSGIELVQH